MSSKATLLFLSCGEIKRSGRSHRVALSVPALNVARNWIRAPDYIVALSRPRENRVITRMQNWCPIERTRILMRRGFPSHEDYQQRFWESTKGSYPQFFPTVAAIRAAKVDVSHL